MGKNESTPPKLGDPLSRSGRLHAGCILDYGPRPIFGDRLDEVCAMSSAGRYETLVEHLHEGDHPKGFEEIMRRTLSEIDAWLQIERIRDNSRN